VFCLLLSLPLACFLNFPRGPRQEDKTGWIQASK
jgi:hypothetical protein